MNKNLFANLKGKKVSAIVFVLDYLQLQLDGPVISFLEFPKIKDENDFYSFGDVNYRNKICELIGSSIFAIKFTKNEIFCLVFDNKINIFCSLKPEDYNLPEMIIYDDGNNQTIVL